MAAKSMILKDLRCLTCSNLNIIESISHEIRSSLACKSMILIDLKSFRIILLRVSCWTPKKRLLLRSGAGVVRGLSMRYVTIRVI
jgi:hypothetical protein